MALIPRRLELHVLDTTAGAATATEYWVNANYGTDSSALIVVSQPGTATNGTEWTDEPWETYWLRCLRCWQAMYELRKFIRTTVSEVTAAEVRRQLGGTEQ